MWWLQTLSNVLLSLKVVFFFFGGGGCQEFGSGLPRQCWLRSLMRLKSDGVRAGVVRMLKQLGAFWAFSYLHVDSGTLFVLSLLMDYFGLPHTTVTSGMLDCSHSSSGQQRISWKLCHLLWPGLEIYIVPSLTCLECHLQACLDFRKKAHWGEVCQYYIAIKTVGYEILLQTSLENKFCHSISG